MIFFSFKKLHKDLIIPKEKIKKLVGYRERYLDVYPLIFSAWDNIEPTVSLTLQLGWIISKVDIWRKFHQLRILSIVKNENKVNAEEQRLKKLLHTARITEAIIKVVHFEESDFSHIDNSSKNSDQLITREDHLFSNFYKNLSVKQKYSILNKVFKRNSEKTSKSNIDLFMCLGVIFVTLPPPPQTDDPSTHANYLEEIEILTNDLPPTMLVYGSTSTSVINIEY